jgi:KDO2-lipid IV(A) lauroyltransferase
MYRHLGHSAAEFLRLATWSADKIAARITLDGFEQLRAAVRDGRGVVVVTAHFGNWDLLACLSAMLGIPLHVVTRELKGGRTNSAWMRARERRGVHLHPAAGSIGALLAALRRGEVVAFVVDQHMPGRLGVGVPFFGRMASTIDAPAVLAARTGAPLLPAFLFREGFERHRLWVGPRIPPADGERRAATLETTARITKVVEDTIRAHPEQWIWMHRRWKLADALEAEARHAQSGAAP